MTKKNFAGKRYDWEAMLVVFCTLLILSIFSSQLAIAGILVGFAFLLLGLRYLYFLNKGYGKVGTYYVSPKHTISLDRFMFFCLALLCLFGGVGIIFLVLIKNLQFN